LPAPVRAFDVFGASVTWILPIENSFNQRAFLLCGALFRGASRTP
jgi:hypothetical protein